MKWFYGLYPTDRIKIKNDYYYISNFFPKINILFSIWPILSNCRYFFNKIKNASFRGVFSISKNTEVIADSGAFGYYRLKDKSKINLNLNSILRTYDIIKPDYAVHNDIPISFLGKGSNFDKNKLLKKNLSNARVFLKKYRIQGSKLVGVAQGISNEDYKEQIMELYHIGYNYIGIGGIAFLGGKRINSILRNIFQNIEINKLKINLHIFGVGRLFILKQFKIYSFDNTTPLNDSHRDKFGKRTYYYIFDKSENSYKKESLSKLRNQKYQVICTCPVCKILQNEILLTGSAFRNHSRAFHNANIYQKVVNLR